MRRPALDADRLPIPRLHLLPFAGVDPADVADSIAAMKEVMHELGHTVGLVHCDDPLCVMHFSNSVADTDAKSDRLCPACRATLSRSMQRARR